MLDFDAIVASQNITWLFFSGSVAALMGFLLYRYHRTGDLWDHPHYLMLGIFAVSLGAFLHRFIWAIWRILRGREMAVPAEWLAQNAWWMTAPAMMLIVIGYIYHLRLALRLMSEKYWFWIGVLISFTVWIWAYIALKT